MTPTNEIMKARRCITPALTETKDVLPNDIPSPSLSKLLSKEEEDLPSNIFNPYPSLLLHGAK
jgi:hypothetical protein